MSLRKDIEAAEVGDVIVTKQTRTGVYVAAARAGVKISTKELADGSTEITIVGEEAEIEPATPVGKDLDLVAVIKNLSTRDRLLLFAEFELCCGMNRGECTCEPEEFVVEVSPARKKIDELRDLIAPIENRGKEPAENGSAEPSSGYWTGWSEEREQYDRESGEIVTYRQHLKTKQVKELRRRPSEASV